MIDMANELISIIIGNMKTEQQPNQSQTYLQEFGSEEEEEIELTNTRTSEGKYMALVLTIIIVIVAAVVLLALFIAASLGEVPKVHIEYLEEAYLPSSRRDEKPKVLREVRRQPSIDSVAMQVTIMSSSPQALVDVQSVNMAHRNYQHIMRKLESENSHLTLDKYASRRISNNSSLTYQQYLKAIDTLELTTFPIGDIYNNYIQLSIQERENFTKQYNINPLLPEASICAVIALTHDGLQSGRYYYALKSLLHQEYRSMKVVVINSPEMGMLDDINKLLSQYPQKDITLIDKIVSKQSIGTSFYVHASFHKYCNKTDLTILLRDNGEFIGRQVFKVINKAYQAQKPAVIFTNYLLESSNPLRQKSESFKYHVQLYHSDLANARQEAYKTKYLKVFRTDILLKLGEKPFQIADDWTDGLFEAGVQFAMLELGCGKYYLLEEIMYKATKYDIENGLQVLDARLQQKESCQKQILNNRSTKNPIQAKETPITSKQIPFLDLVEIRNLTNNELIMLKAAFRQVHSDRAKLYSKVYLNDLKTANLNAIDQQSITPASGISINQVANVAKELHIGVRPQLYIDEIKQKQKNSKTLAPLDASGKNQNNLNNKNIPTLSEAKPSPFTEQQIQFCVFLLTDNNYNKLSFMYTIESIITQTYSKFRLIILDNKSNDLTAEAIKHHLSIIPPAQQRLVTFKQASQKLHRSQLLYHAISKYSLSTEVVIVLESGQEFIDNTIFKYLNDLYKKSQTLAVYSSAIYLQKDIIHVGPAQAPPVNIIKEKSFRKYPLYFHQLRSFRFALFSKIDQGDFQDGKGGWVSEGQNEILAYAIEEQACGNIAYLNKLLIRLAKKPQIHEINSTVGFKYECFQPNKLKTAP